MVRGGTVFVIVCAQVALVMRRTCADLGLTLLQGLGACVLLARGTLRPKELGRACGITDANASKLCSKLEEKGVATRGAGATHREVAVSLTERSATKARAISAEGAAMLEEYFSTAVEKNAALLAEATDYLYHSYMEQVRSER